MRRSDGDDGGDVDTQKEVLDFSVALDSSKN